MRDERTAQFHVENFTFNRNSKTDLGFKTGDGQINVKVSSITYDGAFDGEANGPNEAPLRLVNKKDSSLRNTQQSQSVLPELVSSALPSITDFAQRQNEIQYRSQNVSSNQLKQKSVLQQAANHKQLSKATRARANNKNTVMMSKVDSQLSIQE